MPYDHSHPANARRLKASTFTLLGRLVLLIVVVWGCVLSGFVSVSMPVMAAEVTEASSTALGDALVREYFQIETERIAADSLQNVKSKADWEAERGTAREQLFSMLGLDPLPERTPLDAVTMGTIERDGVRVENVQFQSSPGLYVTGNLYLPIKTDPTAAQPRPAILYVCGHGGVFKEGVSYGNKVHYQHHGCWFAQHGYVCLAIDTIQLGEIQGIHHGTHKLGMWWWHSRGYTPAGVEAWNGIRALDYLQSRPEVDPKRLGVTGRSGGGAYSWWVAALDDRVKVAVPVAGITSMRNHVVDDCIAGHCDCMFMVNTYAWDFANVAALMAPRPLLISNTDKDGIFPLDGVYDVFMKTRRIYDLYGARDKLGLQITEGPHSDTQELHIHAFVWFDRFLKGERRVIEKPAVKLFTQEELKVFDTLPSDERVTSVQEWFVPAAASPAVPKSVDEWNHLNQQWMEHLTTQVFRGWPTMDVATSNPGGDSFATTTTDTPAMTLIPRPAFSRVQDGVQISAYDFVSQHPYTLRLYVAHKYAIEPVMLTGITLNVLDQQGWEQFANGILPFLEPSQSDAASAAATDLWDSMVKEILSGKEGVAWIAPRGVGTTEWTRDPKLRAHILRRFALLGQTADGMRVWDIRRAMQSLRMLDQMDSIPLTLRGERDAAVWSLYASLFEPAVAQLDLAQLPTSHATGPAFLNVLRYLDMPQAVAMAASRSAVELKGAAESDVPRWSFASETSLLISKGNLSIKTSH